jgi:hypothetical protein
VYTRLLKVIFVSWCISLPLYALANAPNETAVGENSHYVKAEVYFYNWSYISEKVRSISDTRNEHIEFIEIVDSAALKHFVSWLQLGQLTKESKIEPHQAALVIDLVKSDGSKETYYSNGCKLYSEDSEHSRIINSDFRKQFDFFGADMIMRIPHHDYDLCAE